MRATRAVAALAGITIGVGGGTSVAAGTNPPEYCAAHLAVEAAFNTEDPEVIGPAVEALFAAAPEDLLPTVQTMIDNVPTDGPPTPAFITTYNEVISWVRANCGYADLQALAQDYSFGGIPAEVAAGPTVIELANEGTELHEILLLKRADGADQPVEELLALPDEELFGLVAPVAVAFSYPGESGFAVADLTPGGYIGLCFIPVGTTPEVFEQMMAGPPASGPEAPAGTEPMPHFAHGMIVEFTVTG